MSTLHGIWTALLLIAFVAIVVWAYSARRHAGFERAARSVLDDTAPETDRGARRDG